MPASRNTFSCPRKVGDFDIQPKLNQISKRGAKQTLEPKVLDVLCVLAGHDGEVVSRSLLIDEVWGVEFGGDETLTRAVSQLRKAFAAADGSAEFIETIPKRGYRLLQPVHRSNESATNGPGLANGSGTDQAGEPDHFKTGDKGTIGAPTSYSVAVVPLQTSSGEDEKFAADDIGHDLVAMMSRAPHLRVAAYDPGLATRGADADYRQTAEDFGVHCIVAGS